MNKFLNNASDFVDLIDEAESVVKNYETAKRVKLCNLEVSDPAYNLIAKQFFAANAELQKRFISVATKKAENLGYSVARPRNNFVEIYSKYPLGKLPICYVHAAALVFGMRFDFATTPPERKEVYNETFQVGAERLNISLTVSK